MPTYHGQIAQDYILDTGVFRGHRGGVFVDVGAHDGKVISNTLVFEREYGWSGLCIEPNPVVFRRLQETRAGPCLNVAVGLESGTEPFNLIEGPGDMLSSLESATTDAHASRVDDFASAARAARRTIDVPVRPLGEILAEHDIDEVHYLSVDTEGNEYDVLRSVDVDRVMIHAVTAEINRGARQTKEDFQATLPGFQMFDDYRHELFFVNRRSRFYSWLRMKLAIRWAKYRDLGQEPGSSS